MTQTIETRHSTSDLGSDGQEAMPELDDLTSEIDDTTADVEAEPSSEATRGWWAKLTAFGNYDFCPWANHYVYWLKKPLGWFIVGVVAAALTAMAVLPTPPPTVRCALSSSLLKAET